MESMLSFVTKFNGVVKSHIEETNDCLGKEVVNSKASKTGICVDKIKVAYGAKFSMMGLNYKENEVRQIENFNEDVLVAQNGNEFFFVPVSDVKAMGGSVILVEGNSNLPDVNGGMNKRRQEVFRRFFNTKKAIKGVMPKVEDARPIGKKQKKKLSIFHW